MGRPSGLQKTGGRVKGTPNRQTVVLRSVTEALGLDVPQRLRDLLPQLDPGKQADVLLDLMGYLYPKRKAIEHSGPQGEPISIASHQPLSAVAMDPDVFEALVKIDAKLQAPKPDSQ